MFRQQHFLNIAQATAGGKSLGEVCDSAEQELIRTLESCANYYWNQGYETAERRYSQPAGADGASPNVMRSALTQDKTE